MQRFDLGGKIAHVAVSAGVLKNCPKYGAGVQIIRATYNHLYAQGLGAGLYDGDILRMTVFIDKEGLRLGLGRTHGHGHGLSGCGGLVQK